MWKIIPPPDLWQIIPHQDWSDHSPSHTLHPIIQFLDHDVMVLFDFEDEGQHSQIQHVPRQAFVIQVQSYKL